MNDFVETRTGFSVNKHANYQTIDFSSHINRGLKQGYHTIVIVDPTPNSKTDTSLMTEDGKRVPAIIFQLHPKKSDKASDKQEYKKATKYSLDHMTDKEPSDWPEMIDKNSTIDKKCFIHFGSQKGYFLNALYIYCFNHETKEITKIFYAVSVSKTIDDYAKDKKEGTFFIDGQKYQTKNGDIYNKDQKKLSLEKSAELTKKASITQPDCNFFYNTHPNNNIVNLHLLKQFIFNFGHSLGVEEAIPFQVSKICQLDHLKGETVFLWGYKKMKDKTIGKIFWAMHQESEGRNKSDHMFIDMLGHDLQLAGNTKMKLGIEGPLCKYHRNLGGYVPTTNPPTYAQQNYTINFVWGGQSK